MSDKIKALLIHPNKTIDYVDLPLMIKEFPELPQRDVLAKLDLQNKSNFPEYSTRNFDTVRDLMKQIYHCQYFHTHVISSQVGNNDYSFYLQSINKEDELLQNKLIFPLIQIYGTFTSNPITDHSGYGNCYIVKFNQKHQPINIDKECFIRDFNRRFHGPTPFLKTGYQLKPNGNRYKLIKKSCTIM